MNDSQLFQALEKIVDETTFKSLKSAIVLKNGTEYVLFNKYVIVDLGSVYQITRQTDDSVKTFSSLKYAVTWVTLDNSNMVYEANRVVYLDIMLSGIYSSSALYERYLKTAVKLDLRFIYANKIKENNFKKRNITSELDTFVRKAKNRQLKRFTQTYNK
jgi:hypothetical protein